MFVTRISFLVIAALAGAGCYNPGFQPCELACSANRECPDGLACNGQNACAATSTAICNEPPIDAPELDAPLPTVTIEVRDERGSPVGAALVVFTDAAGMLVAEMPTGSDGKAMTNLPDGGGATVIRSIPRGAGLPGTDFNVTTYLDLWPGAQVISQALQNTAVRAVTVNFAPPGGYNAFAVYASCATPIASSASPITVSIPVRCSTFDVIVTASSTSTAMPVVAAVLPAQSAMTILVPAADFKPTRAVNGALRNVPGANQTLGAVPWTTSSLPPPVFAPSGQILIPATAVITHTVPISAGLVTQLAVDVPSTTGGVSRQSVFDRFAPMPADVDRDYAGAIVPWLGRPSLNYTSRAMAWTRIVPNGVTTSAPTFFLATAQYTQGDGAVVVWRLFGAASRVMPSGTLQAVIYPDVPNVRAFEPTTATTSIFNSVSLFQVEPLAGREVLELFDVASTDGGFFTIPALRHVTVSTSL